MRGLSLDSFICRIDKSEDATVLQFVLGCFTWRGINLTLQEASTPRDEVTFEALGRV